MAAPTRVDFQTSNITDSSTTETTASITWQAGDWIILLGATEDSGITFGSPSGTGLSFSTISGLPTSTASNVHLYGWTANPGSGGSSTITATASLGRFNWLAAWVYRGSTGVGNTSIVTSQGSTTTQSLTRSAANSAVIFVLGDWGAGNDVTVTWSPSGQNQRINSTQVGAATYFAADWDDQGSAGSTSYGFSAGNATATAMVVLEILGTSDAGPGPGSDSNAVRADESTGNLVFVGITEDTPS